MQLHQNYRLGLMNLKFRQSLMFLKTLKFQRSLMFLKLLRIQMFPKILMCLTWQTGGQQLLPSARSTPTVCMVKESLHF